MKRDAEPGIGAGERGPVQMIPVRYEQTGQAPKRRGFGTALVMGVLLGMLSAEALLLHQVAGRSRLVLIEPWDDADEVATLLASTAAGNASGASTRLVLAQAVTVRRQSR